MLLQLIAHQPQVLGAILQGTPAWVWGTLAALLALGYSQTRDRHMSRGRVAIMPLAMTGLSAWGMVSAFGSSPQFAQVLLAWFAAFAALLAVVAPGKAHARYDAASRSFEAPGSWLPMLLILAIFLTK